MPVENRIPVITLSDEAEERLTNRLHDMVEDAEEFHGKWTKFHAEYQRLYRSRPEYDVKNSPWPNASNFMVPVTQVTVNTTAAMIFDAMFGTRPDVVGLGWEDDERAMRLSRYYFDLVFNGKVFSLHEIGNDWNMDSLIDGVSAVKVRQNNDSFLHRQHEIIHEPIESTVTESLPLFGEVKIPVVTGIQSILQETAVVQDSAHPQIEVVNMERLKVAPGSGPSLEFPECPWYYEEVEWDEYTVLSRLRDGGWKHLEEAMAFLEQKEPTEKETEGEKAEGTSGKRLKSLTVNVFYMRYTLPGTVILPDGTEHDQSADDPDGYPEEVIVWYLPGLRRITRIVPLSRVRPDGSRPHIDNRWIRLPRSFYGIGIPAQLRQINELMNSTTNQMIDYGTLRNMPWGFYDAQAMGIQPDQLELRPGLMIPSMNPQAASFPRFQGDNTHWIQLMQSAQQWGERVTHVTDPTMGRSSSAPNAPRTFRGQNQVLQQGSKSFGYRVELMARGYRRLFRAVHVLYQKRPPSDLELRMFNSNSGLFDSAGKLTRDDFRYDVDFEFRLNPDRSGRQQELMTMLQIMTPVFVQMQNIVGLRQLYKQAYESTGLKNFEQVWPAQQPVPIQGPPGQPGQAAPQGMSPAGPQAAQLGLPFDNQSIAGPAPPETPQISEQELGVRL